MNIQRKFSRPAAACIFVSSILPSVNGIAQTALKEGRATILEEITITAQKREQSLQDTPIAVSVLTEDQLEMLGAGSLESLKDSVIPSLRIVPHGNNPSTLTVAIRGNGPTDIAQATREGSVGIYLDGIYLGRAQGLSMELAELERVEVLRGPQGTLFGRNSTAGAISLVSKKPTGEFGIEQTLGVGRYDAATSITRLNLPEFAGLSTKLEYMYSDREGWVKNAPVGASGSLGDADFNESQKQGGRLSLYWEPSDELELSYSYDNSDIESSHLYFQLYQDASGVIGSERTRVKNTRFPIQLEPSQTDVESHALNTTWKISDTVSFKSITGYRELEEDSNNNFGGTLGANGLVLGEDTKQRQKSQEFQLIGSHDNVEWVAGLYYFKEKVAQDIQLLFTIDTQGTIFGSGIPFSPIIPATTFGLPTSSINFTSESKALYGQSTITLTEHLDLTFGARYTEDKKSGNRNQFTFQTSSRDYDHLDGSLTLNVQWQPNVSTYIKWGSAYKAGGVNVRSQTFAPYDKEEVETWELGFKSEFWDQRLRLNLAAFFTDYDQIQFDFVNPNNVTVNETLNATEQVEVDGFEMDLAVVPFSGLIMTLAYTYLDDEAPLQPNPLNTSLLQKFEITQTPKHAGSLMLDYTFSPSPLGSLSAHLDITSTDRFAYVATPSPHQDSYTLVNARLTLADIKLGQNSGALRVSAWGKNLTDEEYLTLSFPVGDAAIRGIQAYGMPRTAGIDIHYQF